MKRKAKRKPATINRHFSFLRHVLQIAFKDGKVARNPVSGIKFFPEKSTTRFFTDDEIQNLQSIMSLEDWKLVAFAINTGLRRGEQFNLRWDQISFESRTLTLPLPKGGRTRHVPLNEEALNILRSLNSLLSPWVFPRLSNPMLPESAQTFVNRVYTPALGKAGITGGCWHTLRHTAASKLVMSGVDLLAVKEILGHRDIQTTLKYAHLKPGHLHDAINKIGVGTVTKTVTSKFSSEDESSQVIENEWLGDEDSNLDRQSQSLPSCH